MSWGAIKSERGEMMGCKIARLKLWGAKSHNWQTIGRESAIKSFYYNLCI